MMKKCVSLADFRSLSGADLQERVSQYYCWQLERRENGSWVYDKTLMSAPLQVNKASDGCGRLFEGSNYCSQDYLSLSSHPLIKGAASSAMNDLGVHSAGSSALMGNTIVSRRLESELAEFVEYPDVLLFPTGWAAGYGVVKALVRDSDWVVLDALSHACLQEGARAATKNVASFPHLDNAALEKRLARIRSSHPECFILAISETVFSMNSDTPDLREFVNICKKYSAVSLIDVAHDLGCIGKEGKGQLEVQQAIGGPDLLIGSFSKTFASNGGFVASKAAGVKEYLKMYSCPQTFSNALSPIQVEVVRSALSIIRSSEGEDRRRSLLNNSIHLRHILTDHGFECLGEPSAIVPVFLGEDSAAREFWVSLSNRGVSSNFVEFPGVATNRAILRLQVQSSHTREHADRFVSELVRARRDVASANRELMASAPAA